MTAIRRLTETDLRQLIAGGEGQKLDFKRELGHPDKVAGWLVCFANAEGGEVLVGVDPDNRRIVGVADPERVKEQVQTVARNNVEVPLRGLDCERVETRDGTVVVVRIPRSPDRPHVTSQGIGSIRRGSTCQRLTPADWRWLVQSTSGLAAYLDERLIPGTGHADLDLQRVEEVLARDPGTRAGSAEQYLRAVRLLREEGATLAAVLCYGREPQIHVPQAVVVLAKHRGLGVDRQPLILQVGGRLDQQYDGAASFIREHMAARRDLASPGDEDRGIPGDAVRQTLANALAHRDYEIPSNVRIHLYEDRLEVMSPGGLLNSVTLEAMSWGGIHLPRNPRIYWELFRMGLATRTGLGIRRVRDAMAERGLPEPEVRVVGGEFHVVLRLRALEPA